MPLPPLPDSAVTVGAHASDWRDAVELAGEALTRSGATEQGYGARMIQVIEDAPGLALAHARPGPDVHHDGLSVVTLDEPVVFGHPHNDPVSVVIGLAVSTPEGHVRSVAELANVFNDPEAIPALAAAADVAEVQRILTLTEDAAR